MLGGTPRSADIAAKISELVEQEVLVRRDQSRFPGEDEFAFRHALLREGAYSTLTEADRTLGHRLAAGWLEQAGESDPLVLAEHFERGGDPVRAGSFYLRAAEQALRGGDTDATMASAHRGLACKVSDDVKVELLAILCEAYGWRNEWGTAAEYAAEVMRLAVPGSIPWAKAGWVQLWDKLRLGALDELMQTVRLARDVEPLPDAVGAVAWTLATGLHILDLGADFERAKVCLDRVHAIVEPIASKDPIARAVMCLSHAHREACANEDPWAGLAWARAARASYEEANHSRYAQLAQVFVGMNLWLLGAFDEAEHELRATMAEAEEYGGSASLQQFFFVEVQAERGALDEALAVATRLAEFGQTRSLPIEEGRGRWARADVLRRLGDLEEAEREALLSVELLSIMPVDQMAATATLAVIRLARGHVASALETAERAMAAYEARKAFGFRGSFARLVHAEALHAAGDLARAREAIGVARDRLRANADKIDDPALHRSFLQSVPENARTLALARAWLGEDLPITAEWSGS
ncbi:hypothetical protein [Polyangium aurulentum]|uniref:hypothetical protein n=1 Tax=Polyangium aurulentum TaxID=2567896 RepID=UPI0010AEEAFB|nr:hypothetical protein [Polyangium aurulentum]UQA63202.1 hypothetical protein E8A73_023150 [Polyangium aurulentum]